VNETKSVGLAAFAILFGELMCYHAENIVASYLSTVVSLGKLLVLDSILCDVTAGCKQYSTFVF
jgi:hypothetical protein